MEMGVSGGAVGRWGGGAVGRIGLIGGGWGGIGEKRVEGGKRF